MHLLDGDDMALSVAYRAWRGARLVMPILAPSGKLHPVPMGHIPGGLPFAGGSLEQPACVMASLAIMAGAEAALTAGGPQ